MSGRVGGPSTTVVRDTRTQDLLLPTFDFVRIEDLITISGSVLPLTCSNDFGVVRCGAEWIGGTGGGVVFLTSGLFKEMILLLNKKRQRERKGERGNEIVQDLMSFGRNLFPCTLTIFTMTWLLTKNFSIKMTDFNLTQTQLEYTHPIRK